MSLFDIGKLMKELPKFRQQFKENAAKPEVQAKVAWVNEHLSTPEGVAEILESMAAVLRLTAKNAPEWWSDPRTPLCQSVDILCEKDPELAKKLNIDPSKIRMGAMSVANLEFALRMLNMGSLNEDEQKLAQALQRAANLGMMLGAAAAQERVNTIRYNEMKTRCQEDPTLADGPVGPDIPPEAHPGNQPT